MKFKEIIVYNFPIKTIKKYKKNNNKNNLRFKGYEYNN